MRRWTVLTGVLIAGALVAGSATPALAATTRDLTCNYVWPPTIYRFTGNADYTDSSVTGLRRWTVFRFMVHGGRLDENKNNVNIRLYEYGDLVFSYNSPDSLEFNRWYSHRPDEPVYTTAGRDHRTNADLRFEAIFDRRGIADPRCTASGGFQ